MLETVVATAAGTLVGALAAFLLEAHRRKNEREEIQRSKLLHAQFILAQKLNSITNLKNLLDQTPQHANPIEVPQMYYKTIDDVLSSRDLEPLIDSHWADQAAEILRCDRQYADAVECLSQFNQQKDRIENHPNTKFTKMSVENAKGEAYVDAVLVVDLDRKFKNLRDSVDRAHRKLPEALASLKAFMQGIYRGKRTISVTPKKT